MSGRVNTNGRGGHPIPSQRRAVGLKFLRALALALLFASVASPQILETSIILPDTLGPLNGPYHLAWDSDSAHPRLYIGGAPGCDSSGVIVADAITCRRLARVPTNTPSALCFVQSRGKLYLAKAGRDSVVVVDCATNRIASTIHTASIVPVMMYNSRTDRLYCGGSSISVIDCAADTVIHTIAAAATAFALDSTNNKLYAAGNGPLSVIDCAEDTVVAAIPRVDAAGALCFNPIAHKVYATSGDTLYAIQTSGDSIVAQLPFAGLASILTCDPQRNRIYCAYNGRWASIDCVDDTVTMTRGTGVTPRFIACNVARDRLYVFREYTDAVTIYDATSGQQLTYVMLDGVPSVGGWSPSLNRLCCLPSSATNLLSVVDGAGDSIAGIVPLRMVAENIVLDTVHNRLYFMYGSSACGGIGVADCSRNVVTSYTYAGEYPVAMCYNPNNNRLYWGTGSSIVVYDCSTNAVIGKVEMSGGVQKARLHLGLNKLYVYAIDRLGHPIIDVIDCERDSVARVVALPDRLGFLFLVPEDNRLWGLGTSHVTAIDCLGDSIIADVEETLRAASVCASPDDRRIFAACGESPFSIIDMDSPADIETLFTVRADHGQLVSLIPNLHKLYWAAVYSGHPPGNSFIRVIDTRTGVVDDSFWAGYQISGMCLDHTGDYVYCAGYEASVIVVIDARVDSVVAILQLPFGDFAPPLLNRRTGRVYPSASGNPIQVIRDSMLIGLEELQSARPTPRTGQTVLRRGVPLASEVSAELYDTSGRVAAVLRPGLNDVAGLALGVYFVRAVPQAPSRKPQAVRKVIVVK
jgi:DNA-binding beta-propeller fold protein YncE